MRFIHCYVHVLLTADNRFSLLCCKCVSFLEFLEVEFDAGLELETQNSSQIQHQRTGQNKTSIMNNKETYSKPSTKSFFFLFSRFSTSCRHFVFPCKTNLLMKQLSPILSSGKIPIHGWDCVTHISYVKPRNREPKGIFLRKKRLLFSTAPHAGLHHHHRRLKRDRPTVDTP